jgi:hypothetical protein
MSLSWRTRASISVFVELAGGRFAAELTLEPLVLPLDRRDPGRRHGDVGVLFEVLDLVATGARAATTQDLQRFVALLRHDAVREDRSTAPPGPDTR